MKTRKRTWGAVVASVAIIAFAAFLFTARTGRSKGDRSGIESRERGVNGDRTGTGRGTVAATGVKAPPVQNGGQDRDEISEDAGNDRPSGAESREIEEARLVDAFDAETDRWLDAKTTHPPSMEEIDAFRDMFRMLPAKRKEECLQRSLNLIPDENIMLLVGILMDKSEDKKIVELIYNDMLNRDESIKKPILLQIFKDKEHPCWVDTAWILDVTGEIPKK